MNLMAPQEALVVVVINLAQPALGGLGLGNKDLLVER
jgi:hypothetical protein